MRVTKLKILLLISGLLYSLHANAEAKYEIGLGGIVTSIPDYVGSDESSTFSFPIPYFWYQSENLSLDRNSLQGKLWESDRFKLDVSAGGSIPVKSTDNRARQGMDDLDWIGEIGPSLEWFLVGRDKDRDKIYLKFSVRGAVATNFRNFQYIGYTVEPKFVYEKGFNLDTFGKVDFITTIGFPYSNDKFHDYVYGVDQRYATVDRSAYEAEAGSDGMRLAMGISARKGNLWYGVFAKYYDISNASFADSPLVKDKQSYTIGIAMAYIFKRNY